MSKTKIPTLPWRSDVTAVEGVGIAWEEWRTQYAKTIYEHATRITEKQSLDCADAARETYDEDPGSDPVESALSEMSYWDDDG